MRLAPTPPPTATSAECPGQRQRGNVHALLGCLQSAGIQRTALCEGIGDDYAMYRGVNDPRFIIVAHDFDTILGQGDCSSCFDPETSIWVMADNPRSTDPTQRANFLPVSCIIPSLNLSITTRFVGCWPPRSPRTNCSRSSNRPWTAGCPKPPAPQSRPLPWPASPVSAPSFLAPAVVMQATVQGEPDSPTYQDQRHPQRGRGGHHPLPVPAQQRRLRPGNGGHHTHYTERPGRRNLHGICHRADDAGIWQAESNPTISKTWAVLSSLRRFVLSEVLALNQTAVNHEGTFPDLVELRNTGSTAANLGGMRLTDDLNDPNKFVFPGNVNPVPGAILGPLRQRPGWDLGVSSRGLG